MAQRIFFLPDDLASQIAAGEVVERPSSVVKELIENSLDADASRIEVSIEAGGVQLIEVMDDGRGMSPEDAPLCLGRHATSKLSAFENLLSLASYGFRGEALPSVASVSRLSIRTREQKSDSGLLLSAEGTVSPTTSVVASPVGTTISVRDLFFNVPARRKFLRSTTTESSHVTDVIVDAALSRPEVTFSLTRDGRRQKFFPRVDDREKRVKQVLAEEDLFSFVGDRGPLRVEAYLAGPSRARRGALGLKFFVNERPIKDRALAGTVAHAFGELLERGRYPRGVIYLTLPSDLVDVNVHPQKTEVRFSDARAVADAVYKVISNGTSQFKKAQPKQPAPEAGERRPLRAPAKMSQSGARRVLSDGGAQVGGNRYRVQPGTGAVRAAPKISKSAPPRTKAPLRFLAQVKQTYLLCEGEAGLFVLDQHAADETRLHRELSARFEEGQIPQQALLFPVTAELSPKEMKLCRKNEAMIRRLGLELRFRSERAVSVHAVPRLLLRTPPETALSDLLLSLGELKAGSRPLGELAVARMACHEALPPGERLGREEAEGLVRALRAPLETSGCRHGRPVLSETLFSALARRDSSEGDPGD